MSAPKVKLAELWERTSANGNRYFSGFLGASQVLLFREGEREHPTRAGETVTVWNLLVQEREQQRSGGDRPTRNAERGQGTWDRSRERRQAQAAGRAVHDAAPDQDRPFYDDSEAAIAALEGRR